jgi:hypothetical protein
MTYFRKKKTNHYKFESFISSKFVWGIRLRPCLFELFS